MPSAMTARIAPRLIMARHCGAMRQPCGVRAFGDGLFARRQAIVDVPPRVRRCVVGIDAADFDRADRLQSRIDLRPAVGPQQNVPAGTDEWQRRVGFTQRNCAYDVDARDDRAEVVRRPAHESEDDARREAEDPPPAIEDPLFDDPSEANPMLDALPEPVQFDTCRCGCCIIDRLPAAAIAFIASLRL